MDGVFAAVDGTLIPIWCPDGEQDRYMSRKNIYAINMQLVCDASGFIIWHNGGRPGRTWDGNGLQNTIFSTQYIPSLPSQYFIIADGGYTGDAHLLVPFKRTKYHNLTDAEHRFNYIHAIVRGIIEKTIGQLKARFRWMLKGTPFLEPSSYTEFFNASCILHNMMLQEKLSPSTEKCDIDLYADSFSENVDDAGERELLRRYENARKTPADAAQVQHLLNFYRAEVALLRRAQARENVESKLAAAEKAAKSSRKRSRSLTENDEAGGQLNDDDIRDILEELPVTPDDDNDDDSGDTLDEDATVAGKKLRTNVFLQLGLGTYRKNEADESDRKRRLAVLVKRGVKQANDII